MAKGEYDEQAKFIADKVTTVAREELQAAAKDGTLRGIKQESIEGLIKIIKAYYEEYSRWKGGGVLSADINDVIEEVSKVYLYAKSNPELFRNYNLYSSGLSEDREALIKECYAKFESAISEIDIEFTDEILKRNKYGTREYVESPKYQFGFLGIGSAFNIGAEDENGVPTRITYFDREGEFLETPRKEYYYNGKWDSEYPRDKIQARPNKMPFGIDRVAEGAKKINPNELIQGKSEKEKNSEISEIGE